MQRYSKVYEKPPREMILLKSLPCLYGKCSFCNYILDNSTDLAEIYSTNAEIINAVTGEFGVLEVINSGSVFEIPKLVLDAIKHKVEEKQIKVLYFEVYYGYLKRLDEMHKFFNNQEVKYRIGLETFDDEFRKEVYNKPFPTDNIASWADKIHGCCLLVCVKGQTKEQILNDIQLALKYFKEVRINVFVNNDTQVVRDEELVKWFVVEVYPEFKDHQNIEILLDNKDLGTYVQ